MEDRNGGTNPQRTSPSHPRTKRSDAYSANRRNQRSWLAKGERDIEVDGARKKGMEMSEHDDLAKRVSELERELAAEGSGSA